MGRVVTVFDRLGTLAWAVGMLVVEELPAPSAALVVLPPPRFHSLLWDEVVQTGVRVHLHPARVAK